MTTKTKTSNIIPRKRNIMNKNKEQDYQDENNALLWYKKNKKNIVKELILSDYIYSPQDANIISGNTSFIVEAKLRTKITAKQMDKYGGCFLEFDKHKHLVEYKEKNKLKDDILYFNYLKDELQIFKLKNSPLNYKWELRYLPFENNNNRKIWKFVVKLQKEELIETIKYK